MMKLANCALFMAMAIPQLALAHQAGDFFMRAGTATVRPTEGSDNVLNMGEFSVDNNTQLGLTFTWMATDHIGIELLAATPFRHKVGLGPTGNLATVRQLPPTLMAQYYFLDSNSAVRPYAGVGINYTTFFDATLNQTARDAQLSDLSVKDSWGIAGQVGLDYQINRDWMLNASLWYMDIDTEVKFRHQGVEQNINTRIDPFVFFFGAGYRF
nr:outer membrane protein OmpW [Pantoea sp. M_9]